MFDSEFRPGLCGAALFQCLWPAPARDRRLCPGAGDFPQAARRRHKCWKSMATANSGATSCHVRDVVAANIAGLSKAHVHGEVFNVGSGASLSVQGTGGHADVLRLTSANTRGPAEGNSQATLADVSRIRASARLGAAKSASPKA